MYLDLITPQAFFNAFFNAMNIRYKMKKISINNKKSAASYKELLSPFKLKMLPKKV